MTTYEVTAKDGRTLAVREAGAPDGPLLLGQHGSPGAGRLYRTEIEAAERLGARLATYDRPGYGGSTPHPGRSIADAAADIAAILDALGAERFATYGWSGGGPHALACAALLEGRCVAAATVAGVAPGDRPDLEFTAGMGEGNVEEFGAAREGRDTLAALLEGEAEGLRAASAEQLAEALAPHLSPPDAAVLTAGFAEHMHGMVAGGLAGGIDGWLDDDLAFVKPWDFDVAAIAVPVAVWQGGDDLMVPTGHGRWLASHVAGAEARLLPEEGHLTLFVNRIGDIQAWLAGHLR